MVQQVKNLVLPELWCSLQLWHIFGPWPRNFHKPRVSRRREKKDPGVSLFSGLIQELVSKGVQVILVWKLFPKKTPMKFTLFFYHMGN